MAHSTAQKIKVRLSFENNGIVIYKIGNKHYTIGTTMDSPRLSFPSMFTDIYPYAFYACNDVTLNVLPNPNLIFIRMH